MSSPKRVCLVKRSLLKNLQQPLANKDIKESGLQKPFTAAAMASVEYHCVCLIEALPHNEVLLFLFCTVNLHLFLCTLLTLLDATTLFGLTFS